jgi:hypothetical protein
MCLGIAAHINPSCSSYNPGQTLNHGNASTQLATLVEEYAQANQLRKSLKKRIEQLIIEKEVNAKQNEDKAKKRWLEAQAEKEAKNTANTLLKEKIKWVQMMDNAEEEKMEKEEEVKGSEEPPLSRALSPVTPTEKEENINEKEAIPLPPNFSPIRKHGSKTEVDMWPKDVKEERQCVASEAAREQEKINENEISKLAEQRTRDKGKGRAVENQHSPVEHRSPEAAETGGATEQILSFPLDHRPSIKDGSSSMAQVFSTTFFFSLNLIH